MSRDCAVVISSCDNYSDIWNPFFTLFNKFWPDNPYPVFLNSETLDCRIDNVNITTLKAHMMDISWTRRLRQALERIDAEYIIFMMDDFFLYDYVDTKRIEEYITYMHEDFDIGSIYFYSFDFQLEECDLPGLGKFRHTAMSKANLTLALWKKSVFLHYLDYDETPWEFEINSLERTLERSDKFYSFFKNAHSAIPYDFTQYGLIAGKWFKATVNLFKEHGIIHDFSIRGFYEEYERGLIPYVARQIKMDSYLIPSYSLTQDNPRLNADIIVEQGYFSQSYDVSGAKNAAIWCLSSTTYGHVIEAFKCTIIFKSGDTKILEAEDVFGSFTIYQGSMYFLKPEVFVNILMEIDEEMSLITIEGSLNKNSNRDDLSVSYGMKARVVPIRLKYLLEKSMIYAELLLVNENYVAFRFCCKLSFDGDYVEKREILDGKERFPGKFAHSYKIDKYADNTIRWDISGSLGGFAIEDLMIEMIHSDGSSQPLDSPNIKGVDGVFVDGYWVFLAPSAHLLLSLPEECPDEIRISGNVMAPMPRKVLRTVIYADNGDSLLSLNGLRFILFRIKRGIKKYGVIGVVKEVIRRVFCR